ncbi:MAG: O-antigen ligase family protein, partial [bacterium]|nr:O-antigen ligase family protein [bacterium]
LYRIYDIVFPMTLNTFLKWTAITGVFAALFVPFLVADSMFFPFITGKNFTFRILTEIAFSAWLLLSLRDASVRLRKSVILWAFVAFVAIIGLADIFGQSPWKSFWSNFERMEGYITLLHLFAYFLVAGSMLSTEKIWKRFLEISLWSSLLMSLYGLLQLFGKVIINQGGVRLDGKFGNATYLAIYLIFNIFFALILIYRDKKLWKSIVYGLIALLHFVILYYTATRGAMLGLIGGLFLSALLVAIFDKTDKRMRIASISVAIALFFLVGAFIAIKHTSFVQNSPVLSRFASISVDDTKTQARAYIWPMAIKGFLEHPILGRGQENFNYVFNANYDPRMYSQEQWFDHTHNIILDWLVAGGLLGLLAYLSLYVSATYLLWKRTVDCPFVEKALFTGLGTAYFFHNLFVFDNIMSSILFVSILAFVHFKSTRLERAIGDGKKELDDFDTRMAGPIVLLILVFVIYFFNWRGIATNKSLIVALQATNITPIAAQIALAGFEKALSYDTLGRPELVERIVEAIPRFADQSIPIAIRQKFYEIGKEAVDTQLIRFPGDARYEIFAGNFYSMYTKPEEAEKHYLRAVELSPRKQSILSQLGNFYVLYKQYDKAVPAFKKTYELDTSYDNAGQLYALSLIYAGRENEAKQFMKERFGTTDVKSDLFLQAYINLGSWSKAIAILRERVVLNPENKDDRMNLVSAYYQSGNRSGAIAALRDYIYYDPSFKTQGEEYIKQIEAGK